jgi:hypothetical protein
VPQISVPPETDRASEFVENFAEMKETLHLLGIEMLPSTSWKLATFLTKHFWTVFYFLNRQQIILI